MNRGVVPLATIAMNPRPHPKDAQMKKRTKTSAAKKPAAKKPAPKRRNPNYSTAMVAAKPAPKRRKRKNPGMDFKSAIHGLLGLAPGAVVGVGGELGLLTSRGEAVAGAVMIAGGLALLAADVPAAYKPLGGAMIGAGAVPVSREVYRMVTASSTTPPAGLVPPAPVAGIGSDYAPRAGEIVMDELGRSMIADGRGGFVGRSPAPVRPAYALQGAGALSNV